MLNVNNMADAALIGNIACLHVVTDFLFPEEEETLFERNHEDTFVVLSSCCVFTRRTWARITRYFESTVPHYHCDVFRSHFRMTSSTFEMLSRLLSASDHIPKANRFGKPCIHPCKQIAVAVWALANQESCRQISDRYLSQPLIHVISAIIVNNNQYCAINSDKSSYTCNCIVLCLIKDRTVSYTGSKFKNCEPFLESCLQVKAMLFCT